jgi:hypothetical protein
MGTRYAGEKPNKKGEWVPVKTPKAAVKKAAPKKAEPPKTRSGGKNYKSLPK